MSKTYLVKASVTLLGGGTTEALDAIVANTPDEAANIANNFFLLAGESAVLFGDLAVLPGAAASVRVSVLAALDMEDEFNAPWEADEEALLAFEKFLEEASKAAEE